VLSVAGIKRPVDVVVLAIVLAPAHREAELAAFPLQTAETISPSELLAYAAIRAPSDPSHHHGMDDWLRQKLISEKDVARYGLRLEDGWQSAPIEQQVIILVPG